MIKKLLIAFILFTFPTIPTVSAAENKHEDKLPGLTIGEKAPDFELANLAGEKMRLSDFKGKKVILNFWATWCPPCRAEMPNIEAFSKEAGENVVILAVNLDPKSDVKGFANKMGVHFPILLDTKDEVNRVYHVLTIPTTYFIDEKGIIRYKYLSSMTVDMMRELVEGM